MIRALRGAMLCFLSALLAGACGGARSTPGATASASSALRGVRVDPPTRTTDFALADQTGQIVRLSEQRGKYVILTFLYTHCPDVCPLIASNLNQALRAARQSALARPRHRRQHRSPPRLPGRRGALRRLAPPVAPVSLPDRLEGRPRADLASVPRDGHPGREVDRSLGLRNAHRPERPRSLDLRRPGSGRRCNSRHSRARELTGGVAVGGLRRSGRLVGSEAGRAQSASGSRGMRIQSAT